MSSLSQNAVVRPFPGFAGRNSLLDRYFYFCMSLLIGVIVVWGFSKTINDNLFHPAIPRPFLLWVHGAVFFAWVAFYVSQSALVRTRNVKLHRLFGWFGVALGAVMVPMGIEISIVTGRFHAIQLHDPDPTFLSVPFSEMLVFPALVALAVYWRKKPEFHRRVLLIATCMLLDAAFNRWDFIFFNSRGFVFVNLVILLGVARDLLVNRRIHEVYRVALPLLVIVQGIAAYLWRGSPAWWLHITEAMLR